MVLVMNRPTHADRDQNGSDLCLREPAFLLHAPSSSPPFPPLPPSFPPCVLSVLSLDCALHRFLNLLVFLAHSSQTWNYSFSFSSGISSWDPRLEGLSSHPVSTVGLKNFIVGLTLEGANSPQCRCENLSSSHSSPLGRSSSTSSGPVGMAYLMLWGKRLRTLEVG